MRTIATTGIWTLDAQVRAYDLLENMIENEDLHSVLSYDAVAFFCKEFDALSSDLERIYDEAALQSMAVQFIQPYKDTLSSAAADVERLTDLHEFAKYTFDLWQNRGFFVRRKALRVLRAKAGFRLEAKRIGNYVAKTYDLMNEAKIAYARAQQMLFAADVAYKVKSGVYAGIRAKLNSFVFEDNPLA